jgi:hypothetical protein
MWTVKMNLNYHVEKLVSDGSTCDVLFSGSFN